MKLVSELLDKSDSPKNTIKLDGNPIWELFLSRSVVEIKREKKFLNLVFNKT